MNLFGPWRSGIRAILKEEFLELEDSHEKSLRDAFKRAESKLYLKDNIDPFDVFKNLDDGG